MNIDGEVLILPARARWDTSSSLYEEQMSSPAYDSLSGHLQECEAAKGRWFELLERLELLRTFLAPRPIWVMGTLVALAIAVLWLWQ